MNRETKTEYCTWTELKINSQTLLDIYIKKAKYAITPMYEIKC